MPAHRPCCHEQGSGCVLLLPVLDTNPIPSVQLFPPSASSCPVCLLSCTPASLSCGLASSLCPLEGPRGHPSHVASPFPSLPQLPPTWVPWQRFWPHLTEGQPLSEQAAPSVFMAGSRWGDGRHPQVGSAPHQHIWSHSCRLELAQIEVALPCRESLFGGRE